MKRIPGNYHVGHSGTDDDSWCRFLLLSYSVLFCFCYWWCQATRCVNCFRSLYNQHGYLSSLYMHELAHTVWQVTRVLSKNALIVEHARWNAWCQFLGSWNSSRSDTCKCSWHWASSYQTATWNNFLAQWYSCAGFLISKVMLMSVEGICWTTIFCEKLLAWGCLEKRLSRIPI